MFFDRTEIESNHQFDKLRDAASDSAVFLAIVSGAYAEREWTRRELEAFTQAASWKDGTETRLFAIECVEPTDRCLYPAPLDTHIAQQFWKRHGAVSMPLWPRDLEYGVGIVAIARQIARKLTGMREAASAIAAASVGERERCVLLAHAAEDVEDEQDGVRAYLEQANITVLPTAEYPDSADGFRSRFEADLARAGSFVQLFSPLRGKRQGIPEGFVRYQAAAAAARAISGGLQILQWRDPMLDLGRITDPEHRALLDGKRVVADGIESFKATIVARVQEAGRPQQPRKESGARRFLFINHDIEDRALACAVRDALPAGEFDLCYLPIFTHNPEENRADLEGNIVDCDALILVNCHTSLNWVRAQYRQFHRLLSLRKEAPRLVELIVEPPEKTEDDGSIVAGLHRLRVHAPIDQQTVSSLATVLRL